MKVQIRTNQMMDGAFARASAFEVGGVTARWAMYSME
jgi:hypothetical protein